MIITIIGYTHASINTFRYLIVPLEQEGFIVNKVLMHPYGEDLRGIDHKDISGYTKEEINNYLSTEIGGSDLVLYSLEGGLVDGQVASICKEQGVLSVGNIFTFWDNSKYQLLPRFTEGINPDIVTVTTESIKELLYCEITSEIEVWGNPHTDRLEGLKEITNTLNIEQGVVNFFSQPSGTGGYEPPMEKCKEMVGVLNKLLFEGYIRDIVIYVHPREDGSWYESQGFTVKRSNNFIDSMLSEYIVSVSSTMLYEGLLIGKKGFKYSNTFYDDFKTKKYTSYSINSGDSVDNGVEGIKSLLEYTHY